MPPNRPTPRAAAPLQLLRSATWQMSFGERAALEGVLTQLRPGLAIEIGTAEGGSLERIAAYSDEVHAFDLSFELLDSELGRDDLDNVECHAGDCHRLLPELLRKLEREGRHVDFALVDGDHSAEGVRRDVEDLLASQALSEAVILVHDTMNDLVRAGLDAISYEDHPAVAYVELDFVPGYVFAEPTLRGERWGGLGLVVTGGGHGCSREEPLRQDRYYEAHDMFVRAERTEAELARHAEWLEALQSSASWRITAPLRRLRRWSR